MKHGTGCIEQLIIDEGFTSIPNIVVKYSKELELDYSDIGILSVLTYLKQNRGLNRESDMQALGISQDLLRRAERLNLIKIVSLESLDFSFEPLVQKLKVYLQELSLIEAAGSKAGSQAAESMVTKMQRDLCDKDKQIRELEQKLKQHGIAVSAAPQAENVFKNIFSYMEQSLARPLDNSEVDAVTEWVNTYNLDEDAIVFLLEEMYSRGKNHISYIEKVARDWSQQGVRSKDDALKLVQSQKAKTGFYGKIARYISLEHNLTVPEMQRVDKWLNDFKFSEDIIMKACDQTVGSRKPSIGYIDSILSDWAGKGLKTVEDIDNHIKNSKVVKKAASGQNNNQTVNQNKQKDWEEFREYEEFSRRQGFRKGKA